MRYINQLVCLVVLMACHSALFSQHHHNANTRVKYNREPQPIMSQALRLNEALDYLGSPLSGADSRALRSLSQHSLNHQTVDSIQAILDPYCLAIVSINPEARVSVERGRARARLTQGGWTSFLVKVHNQAGVTAKLNPFSSKSILPTHLSDGGHAVVQSNVIAKSEVEQRFLDMQMYREKPLLPELSGLPLEYVVLQIYSKDAGAREADIAFNVGEGTQDVGFRHMIPVLFSINKAVKVKLDVRDDDGKPAMASFYITDSIQREPGRLSGFYPLPSRRVAAYDEYPDFFFQKQIYRFTGESVNLAPGKYEFFYSRGPEYIPQQQHVVVPENKDSITLSFPLKRWINMAKLGWISGDHHVHAAGCAHYDSPEEGVPPAFMYRQALGEDLNISAVLTWGPSWYHQKKYFTGKDDVVSQKNNLLRYDVEVSGFPSSHAGHLVLLGLKEDDYPGAKKVEDWPTWTLPILKWAKKQGGVVGYAHSGWGLEPMTPTNDLPNYITPKMDGIGANEYVVTVTQDAVDIYSVGNTPAKWELNMWYHTLNCGFKTRISGETDFPCITDRRVGLSRSYYKSNEPANYDNYLAALKEGRSYVSEGNAHIMDFAINGQEIGTNNSQLKLNGRSKLKITAKVAALLPDIQKGPPPPTEFGGSYWDIIWSRIGESRNVPVELIVNGKPVDTLVIEADGKINEVTFNYTTNRSVWAALRIWGSAHSNPIFIDIDGKPIHEKQSAEWCKKAVEQCWKKKSDQFSEKDRKDAKIIYDSAAKIYERIANGSAN